MARPIKHDGSLYQRAGSAVWWMQYRDKAGERQRESTGETDWEEAQKRLRERLAARDNNTLASLRRGKDLAFNDWADFYVENFSRPPFRAQKSHEVNLRALKHLRPIFGHMKLADLTAEDIEEYLRDRLRQRVVIQTKEGPAKKGVVKASTVHQEFRVLRRMLNVSVRKKLLFANPCAGVEFPTRVDGLFRPHYMTWSEQQRIEAAAPEYLRNVIQILTETGLRVYKELIPMRREHVDLPNRVVWIEDSKTPNGVSEVPLSDIALNAFERQIEISAPSPFLFPNEEFTGHQKSFKTAWRLTLRRAKVNYFRLYDLRSTYATRLSAGGVADEFVTQMLRQGDAKVFKKYSQMKLQMKREALAKLNRQANEGGLGFRAPIPR